VAESVDALVSNTSGSNAVPVRPRPRVLTLASPLMEGFFIKYILMTNENQNKPYKEKQHQFDTRYLEMARIWATNSYCKRRQVGSLIVKGRMIISDGYNGTPEGFENICEDENYKTKAYVLHAEANAITKVAKSNNSSEGATLYVTCSPCVECAKLIIQSGIKRVVFLDKYVNEDGLKLLERAKIEIVHIPL
jgi:dCMP deaminase